MGAWVVVSGLDVNPLSGCDGEIEKRENRNCIKFNATFCNYYTCINER